MTAERYQQSDEVDGKETEPQLQAKGWFRQLQEGEPDYLHAHLLAASLNKWGRVYPKARFYILEDP